jgi:hypothetical protein
MKIQINEPTCATAGCVANARTLEMLRHRQMEKHSQESTKWKNSAYYFQEKCKKLELRIIELEKPRGLEDKEIENGKRNLSIQTNSE